jgi:eukaryotic-like serine/threonine-protein kinase
MKAIVPRCVGRYCIGPEIASGGMATVRLGQLEGPGGFRKLVAIKQLNPDLGAEPGLSAILAQEAQLNSAISHPNVVSIFDVLEHDGELMLVMDYVNGETLAHLLREARKQAQEVPVSVAARMLNDVLHGLHAAHTATNVEGEPLRIVHRDVSPQNIMIGVDGVARVLDFGVAKADLSASYTAPGHVKGKLAYMAPEQVRQQAVDARTDVFAAGIVLWEALSGHRLFVGGTASQVASHLLSGPIPLLGARRDDIGPELERVLQKALARAPGERHSSARDFAEALEASGKLASRAEVAAWIRRLAGTGLEQRARLCAELGAGTVRMGTTPLRDPTPARPFFGFYGWLRERGRRWGAALATGAALVATAASCVMLTAGDPEQREAPPVAAVLAASPCVTVAAPGSHEPRAATALMPPPLRPESLRLEKASLGTRRTKPTTRGAARPARAAPDVLGF